MLPIFRSCNFASILNLFENFYVNSILEYFNSIYETRYFDFIKIQIKFIVKNNQMRK